MVKVIKFANSPFEKVEIAPGVEVRRPIRSPKKFLHSPIPEGRLRFKKFDPSPERPKFEEEPKKVELDSMDKQQINLIKS